MLFDCATYRVIGSGEVWLQEESADEKVKQLQAYAKQMEDDLDSWEKKVKESRSHHYELNYYTMLQLLKLRKELGLVRESPTKLVDPQILALLESISPKVTSGNVQSVISSLEKELAAVEMPPSSSLSSLKTSHNPQLTENDLTDSQKKIFTDLVEYKEYPKLLVLKAFEQLPSTANLYDIQDWCNEEDGKYFTHATEKIDTAGSVKQKGYSIIPKVKVVHRQIINESHPVVQQLVEEYEYDLDASIEAVQLFGSMQAAMDYLVGKEGDSGMFGRSADPELAFEERYSKIRVVCVSVSNRGSVETI